MIISIRPNEEISIFATESNSYAILYLLYLLKRNLFIPHSFSMKSSLLRPLLWIEALLVRFTLPKVIVLLEFKV